MICMRVDPCKEAALFSLHWRCMSCNRNSTKEKRVFVKLASHVAQQASFSRVVDFEVISDRPHSESDWTFLGGKSGKISCSGGGLLLAIKPGGPASERSGYRISRRHTCEGVHALTSLPLIIMRALKVKTPGSASCAPMIFPCSCSRALYVGRGIFDAACV